MTEVFIVEAVRTAVGRYGGSLKDLSARQLAGAAIKEVLRRAGLGPDAVDEVILGCVGQVAEDAYIGRTAALEAGLPQSSTAYAVNRLCSSGLQAVVSASQAIRAGDARCVVAGGVETMSRLPFYSWETRFGARLGHVTMEDGVVVALSDPFERYHMGITAENVAVQFGVGREAQDQFALASQQKAAKALDDGRFTSQILPLTVREGRSERIFDTDEHPRPDTRPESLAKLKPAFKEGGTVTPGNAAGINDGAAALLVASAEGAEALGLKPKARLVSWAVTGCDPAVMGIGPAQAGPKALAKAGLSWDDMDVIELNEAFAAQCLAVLEEWGLPAERVNPNGGAIALGHPVGATAAILVVKALHELERNGGRHAMVTMCIGGGQGMAAIFERI